MKRSKPWRRLALALAVGVAAVLAWQGYRAVAGEPSQRLADDWHVGQRILARDGRVLRALATPLGQRGRPLPIEAIGDRLVIATLVSEDKRFFEHAGVDGAAVLRAMAQNVAEARIVSGASTITQQLVKLLDHGGDLPEERRGVIDKVREAARAENLEETVDKRTILEAYLNRLSYGRGIVGPAEAAATYFSVTPPELSWAQAALLAVLPRAPSMLDPYRHPQRAITRQRRLLAELADQGFLAESDLARALAEPLELEPVVRPFEAPHLTEALVAGHFGGLEDGDTQLAIDLDLQHDVEGLLEAHQPRLADRRANGAAVLVIDNDSGEVLAYVGSIAWDGRAGQVDMVRSARQPGSTLKPFVYALAFENGLSPTEALADVPVRFGERHGGYAPNNFDGRFLGPISAREALAGSLNVPAVRLAEQVGTEPLLARLHDVGITSLDRDADHYGLALALGAGEVPLFQLAEAYVALAREGTHLPLTVRPRPPMKGRRVFDAEVAAAVTDSLSDPATRLRGLGGAGPFDIGFPLAVKTGTSSGYRDSFTLGYTRERTVAVWVGNADGRATAELTGGAGAGPIFADVMRRAMEGLARRPLFEADLLATVAVCPLSGLPAQSACPASVQRRIPKRKAAAEHGASCPFHRHAERTASFAGYVCSPRGDSIVVLPEIYRSWLEGQPTGAPGRDAHDLPWLAASAVSGCGERSSAASLRIDEPAAGASFTNARGGASIALAASLTGTATSHEVELVLDGEVVARGPAPLRATVPARLGAHVLEARPADPRAALAIGRSHFSVR